MLCAALVGVWFFGQA